MGLFDKLKNSLGGGDPELEALIQNLKASDWQIRYDAAQKLGALGSKAQKAVPALEDAIADENGEVCLAASDALSKIRRAAH